MKKFCLFAIVLLVSLSIAGDLGARGFGGEAAVEAVAEAVAEEFRGAAVELVPQ